MLKLDECKKAVGYGLWPVYAVVAAISTPIYVCTNAIFCYKGSLCSCRRCRALDRDGSGSLQYLELKRACKRLDRTADRELVFLVPHSGGEGKEIVCFLSETQPEIS